jgi:hypothetical protein
MGKRFRYMGERFRYMGERFRYIVVYCGFATRMHSLDDNDSGWLFR